MFIYRLNCRFAMYLDILHLLIIKITLKLARGSLYSLPAQNNSTFLYNYKEKIKLST